MRRGAIGTPPPTEKDAHPNRGTLGTRRSDRMWLSAEQLQVHEDEPSWRAPRQKPARWNSTHLITIIVLVAVVALITLRVAGVI